MSGSGLLLVDPPWQIDQAIGAVMPTLARLLQDDPAASASASASARARVEWLVGPR